MRQAFAGFIRQQLKILLLWLIPALAVCLYFILKKDNSVYSASISALYGFLVYLIPETAYFYYSCRRSAKNLSTGTVIYDAFYALALKYMLLIALFGFGFKFCEFLNLIVIFSFVISVLAKIVLYLHRPQQQIL